MSVQAAAAVQLITLAAKGSVMAFPKKDDGIAVVHSPNLLQMEVKITGTAPYVQNKFSNKAKEMIMKNMSTPKSEKKGKGDRAARNYDDDFNQAQHVAAEGWNGIPAPAFRAAMIDACRAANIVMTRAKMSVFIIADGFDRDDGSPLVKIVSPKGPKRTESLVRNDNGGADIRIRPMWQDWSATVRVEFDGDMISAESVVNLLDRAGRQVGIGEGRPFSKNSVGQGWGTFRVQAKEVTK